MCIFAVHQPVTAGYRLNDHVLQIPLLFWRPEDEFYHKNCSCSFSFAAPSSGSAPGEESFEPRRCIMLLTPAQISAARYCAQLQNQLHQPCEACRSSSLRSTSGSSLAAWQPFEVLCLICLKLGLLTQLYLSNCSCHTAALMLYGCRLQLEEVVPNAAEQ